MNIDYLCFQLDNEHYLHNALAVREIMRYETPTPVPGAAASVEGILNVRGEVVAVVSGRRLLGLSTGARRNDNWRIIILESMQGWIALTVDAVTEIVSAQESSIEPTQQAGEFPFIKGTLQCDQQLFIVTDLLNLEHIGTSSQSAPYSW